MKIHQLPNGARFEYKGEQYVKTGPMFATGRKGQELIPRSALLRPINELEPVREPMAGSVSRAAALLAFEAFYAECQALVPDPLQPKLELLRERFRSSLESAP